MNKEKLNNIYELFEVPLIKILSDMEINGIKVDSTYLKKLSKKFEYKINTIEKEIYKLANKNFNIASTKQLGEIIYNELKIRNLK